jgi:hypothetical protein
VVEGDGIGDPLRLHGGFADDRGGAEHGGPFSEEEVALRHG